MGLQIFGTAKCQDSRKAQRFFKERKVPFQFVDLAEKAMSRGELESVALAIGRAEGGDGASTFGAMALIDLKSARAVKRGLAYMDFDPIEEALADPLLLRTPIIRDGRRAVLGGDEKAWAAFLPSGS